MKYRLLINCLGLLIGISVEGSLRRWDDIDKAINQVQIELNIGTDRKDILLMLEKAIQLNSNGFHLAQAKELARDLEASIKESSSLNFQPQEVEMFPEKYLMESRLSPLVILVL